MFVWACIACFTKSSPNLRQKHNISHTPFHIDLASKRALYLSCSHYPIEIKPLWLFSFSLEDEKDKYSETSIQRQPWDKEMCPLNGGVQGFIKGNKYKDYEIF